MARMEKRVTEREAELTWDHIAHSPVGSIEKAKRLLHYTRRYSSLQAVQKAVKYYFKQEKIPLFAAGNYTRSKDILTCKMLLLQRQPKNA